MRINLALLVIAGSLSAGYVVEWSVPLSYSSASAFTSGRTSSYDVNGDSVPDVFVLDSSAIKIYSGVSRSLIWTIPTLPYNYGTYPIVANTDGDANRELVFAGYRFDQSYVYHAKLFIYDCVTRNQEFASAEKTGWGSVSVADIDGDNKSEICFVTGTGGSRILEVYGSDDPGVDEGSRALMAQPLLVQPNPAQGWVAFAIPVAGAGSVVRITDLSGRLVRGLPLTFAPGQESLRVVWDGTDNSGQPLPSGTYFFASGSHTGKVELVY